MIACIWSFLKLSYRLPRASKADLGRSIKAFRRDNPRLFRIRNMAKYIVVNQESLGKSANSEFRIEIEKTLGLYDKFNTDMENKINNIKR